MVRSWWLGPLVLTMAGGGTVWAQGAPERSGTAGATRDRFMTVTEQGKSPTRCRIIQSGTLADGSKVYLVSAVDDGHRITVVQPGRKADGALPATRFYHWTKDNRPPAGVPALMAQDEKPADTLTATEARPFPVPANLGAAEGNASVVKKVVSTELPLTTDGSQPVVVKNEVVTLGEEGSKGKVVDVGPSETSSKSGKGAGQGAGAGTKGSGKGADAGAGTKGAGHGGGKAADPGAGTKGSGGGSKGAGQGAGDGTKGAGHGGLGILGGLGGHGGHGGKAADAGAGTKGAGQGAGDGTKGAGTKGAGQGAGDGTKGAGHGGLGILGGLGGHGGHGGKAADAGAGTKGAGQAAGDGTKGAGTKGAGQAAGDGTKGAGKAADLGAGTKGSGKAADAGAGTKGAGKAADAGAGLKGHGLGDGGMKGGDLGGGTGKGAADASKLPRSVADALDPLNRPLEFQKPVKEKGEAGETVMEKLRKALGLRAGDEASGRGGRDGRLGRGSMEAAGVTGDFTVGQPFPVMLGTPPTPVPTQANIPKPPYMAYIPGPEANPYVPRPDVGVAPGYANAFTLTNTTRPIPADFGNQPMQQNAFATPLPSGPQPTAFAAAPQQGYPQGLPPGMQLPPGMTPGQLPPGMLPPGMLPPGMGAPSMSTPLQSLPQPHAAAAGAGGFAKKKKADKNFDDGSTNAFTSVPQVAPQPVGIVPLNTPLLGRANPATGVQTVNAEIRKVNLEQPVRQLRESLLPSEREKAIDEIGQANLEANTDAASALLTAAFRDPALSVRLSAIRTLGTKLSGSPQVLGALRALMDDPDVRIRAEVEQVLAPANTQLPTPPSQPRTLKGGK